MTGSQRRILIGLGGLVVLVALAFAMKSATAGDTERLAVAGPAGTTTTSPAPESTDTTVPLFAVTTGVPVPTVPPTTRPAAPAAATPVSPSAATPAVQAATAPALTASGAVLVPPSPALPTRAIDKAKGCFSAVDPGWKVADCGALKTSRGVLVWVLESRGKGLRALVLSEQSPGQWAVALAATDDDGSRFSSMAVRGEDVSGDGQPELAFGFHRRTADKVLAVDLVEAPGAVTFHADLAGGSARVSKGDLTLWRFTLDGRAEQLAVHWDGSAWRVTVNPVERSAVPPSTI